MLANEDKDVLYHLILSLGGYKYTTGRSARKVQILVVGRSARSIKVTLHFLINVITTTNIMMIYPTSCVVSMCGCFRRNGCDKGMAV